MSQQQSSPTLTSPSRRLVALALLALIGLASSVYLSQHYYDLRSGSAAFKSLCTLGGSMNCDTVAASSYAELFAGFPLSSFGAGWYLAIFVVALIGRNAFWRREAVRAALALTLTGLLFSLFYLYVMSVLKAFCLFCLIIDGINLAAVLLVLTLKPEGFSRHKPDRAKWKTLVGVTLASLLATVIGLKGLENSHIPAAEADELARSVLSSPALSVNAGPEFASIGPADAPVTIVEFSDFECPYCRTGALILHAVQERYPRRVRLVFRNYPLDSACNRKVERSMHPYACEAARGAICAVRQGRFQPYYEGVFEKQDSLRPGRVLELGRDAGLDEGQLTACMSSVETANALARDVEEGVQLDVRSTPTFFINGRKVEGAYPPIVWNRIIDELLNGQAAGGR